jgi:uncharacterized Tic20 family protein
MSIAEEIEKLNNLRQSGAISEEEYQRAKESLLRKSQSAGERFGRAVDNISSDVNMWGMFIHLSQFCGYIVPLAGLIVPIILWQIKKDESEIIDKHGRIVVNWIITEFIFGLLFALLCLILIGIPLLLALAVVGIVFPIIGAVKANNGEIWPYPLSIRFFRLD